MNPDVGGFAVGIANILINLCLLVLFRWSKSSDDYQISVYGLFSQVYPVLLATVASIGRSKLSIFEAHFAVAVSASPVTVYLAYMAFPELDGKRSLFRDLTKDTKNGVARWLAMILPILWLSLNLVISFHPTAFRNSYLCKGMSFGRWFEFQLVSNFIGVLDVMGRRDLWNDLQGRGGLGAVSVGALWVSGVYLVRHREDIWEVFKERRSNLPSLHWGSSARLIHAIWKIIMIPWEVILAAHSWLLLVIICCLHWSWIIGIVRGISLDQYEFSYGQALSAFSVAPPVVAVIKLIISRYEDWKVFVRTLPSQFFEGVCFFFTGTPNPWLQTNDLSDRIVPEPPTVSSAKAPWILSWCQATVLLVSLVSSVSQATYIINYVMAGSIPNSRTLVNYPHQRWKPFAIGVYIFGFLVGCTNILFWSSYCDRAVKWFRTTTLSRRFRLQFWSIHLMIVIPTAFFFCIAPLFSPFAALPLSQQYQWSHRCDSPFQGEALLTGGTFEHSEPQALLSLYYAQPESTTRSIYLQYILIRNGDSDIWTLDLYPNTTSAIVVPSELFSFVRSISYDLNKNTVTALCSTISQSGAVNMTAAQPCMWGYFIRKHQFAFFLNNTLTYTETVLRGTYDEWQYPDDAPSFTLNAVEPDGRLGGVVMQTAVTKRNHCEILKICLSSRNPTLDILTPLGLALWAQNTYTSYCKTPRLYM